MKMISLILKEFDSQIDTNLKQTKGILRNQSVNPFSVKK